MKNQDPTTSSDDLWVIDTNYVIFVLGIVILTIINSTLLFFVDGEEQAVIRFINLCLSLFLFMDALNTVRKQPHRLRFLTRGRGWMIFIGSLPIPFAGIFRIIFTTLQIRSMRGGKWAEAHHVVLTRRAQSTLLSVVLMAIIVYEVSVLLVLQFETSDPSANIQSASDALWWGIVTVSTVGYGDQFPITNAGRATGVLLIAVGVGLFTSITGYLTDSFRKPRAARPHSKDKADRAENVLHLVEEMRHLVDEEDQKRQQSISTLQKRIDRLENEIRQTYSK